MEMQMRWNCFTAQGQMTLRTFMKMRMGLTCASVEEASIIVPLGMHVRLDTYIEHPYLHIPLHTHMYHIHGA